MDRLDKAYEWLFGGTAYGLTGLGIYANWGDVKALILFVIALTIGYFQMVYWYKKSNGKLK